jgi:hypothetical protein
LLFQRFFEVISNLLPERAFVGDLEALSRLNPNKIYVENVRSTFGISTRRAERYCETAVRQGLFSKFIEVRCPSGEVAAWATSENTLPDTVRCWKEENGDYEEAYVPTRDLPKSFFYRLNDAASTNSYASPSQSLRSHSA